MKTICPKSWHYSIMRTVLVGTINVQEVEQSLVNELASVRESLHVLVNAKPFGEHSDQDLEDYVSLRNQEELLKLQLS